MFLWSDVGCWEGNTGTEFRVELTKRTLHCEFSLPEILLLNILCVCYNPHTHTYTHTHMHIYIYIYIYKEIQFSSRAS